MTAPMRPACRCATIINNGLKDTFPNLSDGLELQWREVILKTQITYVYIVGIHYLLAENWRKFKQEFELYMMATVYDEKPSKQKIALLHVARKQAIEVYKCIQHFRFFSSVK